MSETLPTFVATRSGASSTTSHRTQNDRGLPPIPLDYFGSFQNVLVEARVQPRWRLLEIGCSSGYFSSRLTGRGAQVFGIDLNTSLVAKAAQNCAAGRFCAAEPGRLPFGAASFDAVIMLEVIEHVGEEKPVVEEIRRVLKPGGLLFLSTPHAGIDYGRRAYNLTVIAERVSTT